MFCSALLALSLATYHPADPGLNNAVSPGAPVHNAAGPVGSYAAGILADFFGIGAWVAPVALALAGLAWIFRRLSPAWWRWLGLFLLWLSVMGAAESSYGQNVSAGLLSGGGFLGRLIHAWSLYYLKSFGSWLLWLFATLTSLQLLAGVSWTGPLRLMTGKGAEWRAARADAKAARRAGREKKRRDKSAEREEKKRKKPAEPEQESGPDMDFTVLERLSEKGGGKAPAKGKAGAPSRVSARSGLPDLSLLEPPRETGGRVSREELERLGERLVECLAEFGIQGEIAAVEPGPVVTMFEYRPAPGVKISRIAGLSDDLALALKAQSVRIEAPLPGRDTVGVEIPNETRQTVYLREVLESQAFRGSDSLLTMALGKDIFGSPAVADLARMPHLLVAGATGMGKSVGLNSILMSLLYKASPEQLRMLLIDPKRIELAVYADMPHLVHPVVTEAVVAKSALEWAVAEMENRYEALARLGVRNIDGYNKKLASLGEERPEELADLEPMPYLVVIIDELADLMLTARKEVETSIVRLAQLARAAGIHMIIATQRPSVDVVTGLIKANFPSRIAFTVTSPQDSRTILDTAGANHLLGKGDMLFKPGGGSQRRLHGAWVTEDEISRVVGHWKAQRAPEYKVDLEEWASDARGSGPSGNGDLAGDPEYREAVEFVREQGKASISLIQRRFRIGFNKAARFVEQMEADGIIGPQEGSKPRQVLRSD